MGKHVYNNGLGTRLMLTLICVGVTRTGDERQIAMNRSRVSTPMHYCDEVSSCVGE